jgi:hypothetical protein
LVHFRSPSIFRCRDVIDAAAVARTPFAVELICSLQSHRFFSQHIERLTCRARGRCLFVLSSAQHHFSDEMI